MSATMNCPGCQTLLRLRDDMAGKKIKCPRCGHVISVPAKEVEELEVVEESAARITAEAPAPKRKGEAAATRRCPECGERITVTARKCRYCQAVIEDEEEEERIARRPRYKPCPRCGAVGARRVVWTFWGSFYGPALFTHVRCPGCGHKYNGRTGGSNLIPAILFVTVPAVLILLILGFLAYLIYHWNVAAKV